MSLDKPSSFFVLMIFQCRRRGCTTHVITALSPLFLVVAALLLSQRQAAQPTTAHTFGLNLSKQKTNPPSPRSSSFHRRRKKKTPSVSPLAPDPFPPPSEKCPSSLQKVGGGKEVEEGWKEKEGDLLCSFGFASGGGKEGGGAK